MWLHIYGSRYKLRKQLSYSVFFFYTYKTGDICQHLSLGVSTFRRFDVTFRSDETWNATIFCYVGTSKRGTQTKFFTFQCNFRKNLTFRSNETWNANFFFFTLDKWNLKRNNSVSLLFRAFDSLVLIKDTKDGIYREIMPPVLIHIIIIGGTKYQLWAVAVPSWEGYFNWRPSIYYQ
jgi:hypothetical protein